MQSAGMPLIREGRCGGGIAYQDTAQVRPCSLFLDFLSRKVLVGNPPTPASTQAEFIHQKPFAHAYARSRGCVVPLFRTVSDMDVATEPPWTGLRRVLKRGTT